MSSTLKRTSMALDAESLQTLQQFSERWHVSKAEVLRRSLNKLREDEDAKMQRKLEILEWFKDNGLTPKQAEEFKAEVQAERMAWRDPWAEHFERLAAKDQEQHDSP